MFKNYLKIAFRSLNKNRTYAIINILGLALGLGVSILVFMFVKYERSYDKHWTGYDRTYRIGVDANMMGQAMVNPRSASPMAEAFRTEFEEVESATRIRPITQEILAAHKDNKAYIQNVVYADSSFFKVFDYEFVPCR